MLIPLLLILFGMLLLFSSWLLTRRLSQRRKSVAASHDTPLLRPGYVRLQLNGRILRSLRLALKHADDSPASRMLQQHALQLTDALLRLKVSLRHVPALPAGEDGQHRLASVAEQIAANGEFTVSAFTNALLRLSPDPLSTAERLALPHCVALAQAEQLQAILHVIREDAAVRRQAFAVACRLPRLARPLEYLAGQKLSAVYLQTLLTTLRDGEHDALLTGIDEWLTGRGISADDIAARYASRQTAIAEDIRTACACFDAIARMNWDANAALDDPLHRLLLEDPAGIYPRMETASCAALRLSAERLSARLRVGTTELIHAALSLCEDAEARSLESHVGYYLTEVKGITALQQSMTSSRHGRIWLLFRRYQEYLPRICMWIYAVCTGFLFVHTARQPLIMLPSFSLVSGCLVRFVLSRIFPQMKELPGMEISAVTGEMRTLVVLHAVLHDSSEAIAMVRHMKTIRHAFPADGVDCLLIADYAPCITLHGGDDLHIRSAASAAVDALSEDAPGRFFYMQRGRVWNPARHTYTDRSGRQGALETICRLIAQGECQDVLEYASIEPAHLHRHYAFVLTLTKDDAPTPGMLEHLLAAASHPLCTRFPTPDGYRGFSILRPVINAAPSFSGSMLRMLMQPARNSGFDGVGLIRPDAFLEATDGFLPQDTDDTDMLIGELAGCAMVSVAFAQRSMPGTYAHLMSERYKEARQAWNLLRWQLPWVQTAAGLIRNPLHSSSRFRIRESIRSTIVPPAQLVLLLWAILTQNPALMLLTLLFPEVSCFLPLRHEGLQQFLGRTAMLPFRACISVKAAFDALVQLLRPNEKPSSGSFSMQAIEIWSQGISSTVAIALGLALQPFWLPSLILGGLFACFPFFHSRLDNPARPPAVLSNDNITVLEDAAAATWHFMHTHVTAASNHLPPSYLQVNPPVAPDDTTSPQAIAAYLLSCVCAREMALIDTEEAADRIRATINSLRLLPTPFGLPCKSYRISTMTVADPEVHAASCGILLSTLMTCAQALRTWLPECPPRHHELPADIDAIANSFDLQRLYDQDAQLFFRGLDSDGQGIGHAVFFADEQLMLSLTACARKAVPSVHMQRLSTTYVRSGNGALPISLCGDAAAYLLPGLFVPIDPEAAEAYINLQQLHGMNGLFGQSRSAFWSFTPNMRYRQSAFGMPELAVTLIQQQPVYAPYAAALCLPFAPNAAARCLTHMREQGLLGPMGYCDATDLSARGSHGEPVPTRIGLYDTFHQGLLLCSAAHVLADAPVQRYFCAIPDVAASLPLLHRDAAHRVFLPPGMRPPQAPSAEPSAFSREACSDDAHLIGAENAHILLDSQGCGYAACNGIRLTRFSRHAEQLDGIQFYLADEGRVYRLTDASLPGRTLFHAGRICFERRCGSLRAVLTVTVDPARRKILHMLEITNLSTADRIIEAADCLLPDMQAAPGTMETARPDPMLLTLRCRATGYKLYHTLTTSSVPVLLSVCTDEAAFLGRGRTLHAPASLEEPMHTILSASTEPCLSFRAQFSLGGRGQLTMIFTTGLSDMPAPALHELPGLFLLADMQAQSIVQTISLTADQELAASLMTAALAWRGRLHQALSSPLAYGTEQLHGLGIPDDAPLILLTLNTRQGLQLMRDVLAAGAWFSFKGLQTTVCIVCNDTVFNEADAILTASPPHRSSTEQIHLLHDLSDDRLAVLAAYARLSLHEEDGPLLQQLRTMQQSSAPPVPMVQKPVPAAMPKYDLMFPSGCSGFDPETNDCLICLAPGQTTPSSWQNVHISALHCETVDESGFLSPFREHVQLLQESSILIDPFGTALPRVIRMGPGYTEWRCFSDSLDISLTASCLPKHPAGLRVLRIKNAAERAVSLVVRVAISLSDDPLSCMTLLPGMVMNTSPEMTGSLCLSGLCGSWDSGRCCLITPPSNQPFILPADTGPMALLTCTMNLPAQSSSEAAWMTGSLQHADQAEMILQAVRTKGTSRMLRSIQASWAQRLSILTVSTPEDTLDLLINRILPMQYQTAKAPIPDVVPALALTSPQAARSCLLLCANQCSTEAEWLMLILSAVQYIRITGDKSILKYRLTGTEHALAQACIDALQAIPLDSHRLPKGDHCAPRCFMTAAAAQSLHEVTGSTSLQELSRTLLNAADTYLWADEHYGVGDVTLAAQSWAALAYGTTTRTRQSVRTAWAALYDQRHGLIRQFEPDDALPPLPGTPGNGGQNTRQAVWFMSALLHLQHHDWAWELLRALNPIHHTDDPLRTEEYCGAPFLLSGGMQASPANAGRAVSSGGTAAAGALYAAVWESMLGLIRRGETVTLCPHVPPDWDAFSITLQHGSSTWHFSLERSLQSITVDGEPQQGRTIPLTDDGKVHQVRAPIA